MEYAKTISKELLESLPPVSYDGNIVVVNTIEQAEAAVVHLRSAGVVLGFDTETRPSFQRGVSYKVSLVQLSAGKTCYLFRLCKMKGLGPLKALFEDPGVVKVGLSTHDDFANLRKWEPFTQQGVIEIQQRVPELGIEDKSLAKVYAILFGKKISKRQRLTNWEAETLTDKQMAYAALDAAACVEIYHELLRLGGRKILSQGI